MKNNFRWNACADQPHNVAPRGRRFRGHLGFAGGYLRLAASNLAKAAPVLGRYRRLRRNMYRFPLEMGNPLGMAVSPAAGRERDIPAALDELGIDRVLFRIPSWEPNRLGEFETFADRLREGGREVTIALLQNRRDVLDPPRWRDFLAEVFDRFAGRCFAFEIGHAWNRTKWGVWDYREYLRLAESAFEVSQGRPVRLAGPAVIDFEFHLYPPLLARLPFAAVTSLLYVDRMGAPENRQAGWDTPRKTALLRAVVDECGRSELPLWISEFNWPLKGSGRYSPAAGRPNVSEREQADFLVRYLVLTLASGFVDRAYWWQLSAPGYGLIDDRGGEWRRRPAFASLSALSARLRAGRFLGGRTEGGIFLFLFQREGETFAVGWSPLKDREVVLPRAPIRIRDRDGSPIASRGRSIRLGPSPCYLEFGPADGDDPSGWLPGFRSGGEFRPAGTARRD
jgi:hypothetical protein